MPNFIQFPILLKFIKTPIRLAQILQSNVLSQSLQCYTRQTVSVSHQPAMIISPHQDDETLGCGGLIALKRQQGVRVAVVFLTDGSGTAPGNDSSAQNYVNLRRKEAIAALQILGVPASDIYFLNYPDGKLQDLSDVEQHALVSQLTALLDQYQTQEVYVPHAKDGHCDHEAAFQMAQAAIIAQQSKATARQPCTIELFQYPIWLFWKRPILLQLKRQDLVGARGLNIALVKAKKQAAIQVYQSQLPVLPLGFLQPFLRETELFFAQSQQEVRETPEKTMLP